MIDRLEEAGLVERRRDEIDRRAWNIYLTEKSQPVLRELRSLAQLFHEEALMGISQEDLRRTLEVLAQVRRNLNRSSVGAARKAS